MTAQDDGAREAAPTTGAAPRAGARNAGTRLLDSVRRTLAEAGAEPTPAGVAAALRAQGRLMGDSAVLGVVEALRSELVGVGPLEPLLADPEATDVLVTAPDQVWVDRGRGLELTRVRFPDAAAVRRLAQRLATSAGRRLDDARPWVDARLPDGTRLHAVLPPVAVGCTCLSLRVVRPRAFSLADLVTAGTVPPGGERLLRAVLDARLSFVVSGGTGCGKTTLLSTLLGLVGPDERIVLAEDSSELRPDHPHVVRLEARPANQEGVGQVELRDLVRQALRMRPDRLVVGEVRGSEVTDLLAALNTGHEGGCGTVHANAAADVPARLEALAGTAGLDRAALHSQLAAALDLIVHVVRGRDGRRRIAQIHVLERDAAGLVATVPAAVWNGPGADGPRGPGTGFVRARGWPRLEELCLRRRADGTDGDDTDGGGLDGDGLPGKSMGLPGGVAPVGERARGPLPAVSGAVPAPVPLPGSWRVERSPR
ncbi:TadA family conjugal transfer-associated ATPase [Streptomyces qinglanensis]|uniref:Pilus assembly protein CpaF n=1 Tax=Streptomyces qinglanensis TaxID=943816 RepID=A0A1H9W4R7_9ACTN|nr:TadA family conjugal transfer-associated ATPase [Streptomyces qinglanensis]SES28865.1 pilus assembly protein CpaF [Streptomyces qinglanensis]